MGRKTLTHPPKNGRGNMATSNMATSNMAKADAEISRLRDCDWVNVNRFMAVIPPGTPVRLGPKREIEATVLETTIKESGYVFYRVSWWSGNERKTEWLEAGEVHRPAEKMSVSIGFGAAQ